MAELPLQYFHVHSTKNYYQHMLFHSIASDGTHVFYNEKQYLYISASATSASEELPTPYTKLDIGTKESLVSAIIGTIKLKVNKYLIVATSHEVTGSVLNNPIARVTGYRIYSLARGSSGTEVAKEEANYLALLRKHLDNATLYFSVDNAYDLTNSLQRQYTTTGLTYDERFWWNSYLLQELLEHAPHFVTPIIYGYFKSFTSSILGSTIEFGLLTRRSIQRAGTRYFRRGIDELGNVANFNETEQIFTVPGTGQIYSLLQTRGSVPIFWSEINNLKYKPNLVISSQLSLDATAKHFAEQTQLYGDTYCVNLVNQSGYEKPVKDGYESAVQNLPKDLKDKVHYIYFDFHHECRKMRWHRVTLLLEHLGELGYHDTNFFQFDLKLRKVVSVQDKIVRTNCMDCLDRTNVVQSTIAREVLKKQLITAGLPDGFSKAFLLHFQNFWADNADAVSCAYSGTGALKTDFTRTGNRTKKGALNDLINSIIRYYKNNYSDGARQDSYDLFLGGFRPYRDATLSPFTDRRPHYVQLLPYLLGTSFLVFFALILFPQGSVSDWKNLFLIGTALIVNVLSFRYLNRNGYQFVNWPKLSQLDFIRGHVLADGRLRYEELPNFKYVGKKGT